MMISKCNSCGQNIKHATCEVHPDTLCTPSYNLHSGNSCKHWFPINTKHTGKYWRDVK